MQLGRIALEATKTLEVTKTTAVSQWPEHTETVRTLREPVGTPEPT